MSGEERGPNPLEDHLRQLPPPPADRGLVVLIVARPQVDERRTPAHCRLTPECGVVGDRWADRESPDPDSQITVMRADVARLLAGGQSLSLFGDNLLVELDISEANLPAGTTLRVGSALCQVTPKPHTGCAKFLARFGHDALRLTATPAYESWRLRGIHLRVLAAGEVAPGDGIEVLARPQPGAGSAA
jgi:MOSC domain-containing protein YiiM